MTKIQNTNAYPFDTNISDEDYVIGSDGDNLGKITRNYNIGDLRRYINSGLSPEIGGTLKVSEIEYNGVLTTPSEVANALDPNVQVLQYEIVVLSVNGNKYLLKEQDIILGLSGTEVTDDDFILIIGFGSLGDGTNVLKGYNSTTGLQEVYSIKSTGNEISIVSENIVIDPKEGVNLGDGIPFYKGLNSTTKLHEFYTGESETLNIILEDNKFKINIPSSAQIPALYVNNLYEPTYDDWVRAGGNLISNPTFDYKGDGTLSKPYTDTVRYTSEIAKTTTANSSIQNALDAYVGGGTRLAPERVGEKIIVQDNNSAYSFSGDLGYSRLKIDFNGNVTSTTTGYIFDMDNTSHFNNLSDLITINVAEGYILTGNGDGFNNSGSNVATNNLSQSRTAYLNGYFYFPTNSITKYGINSDILSSGNNNDGGITFELRGRIRSDYQGVYKIGGVSRIYNYGALQSGTSSITVDTTLKPFLHLGGQVRCFQDSSYEFSGARNEGFTFTPTGGFTPSLITQSTPVISLGTITDLYNKTNNELAGLSIINSNNGTLFEVTNIFNSTNLWLVSFRNNILESGEINTDIVDLTQGNNVSCVNYIGNNIIESLVVKTSRQQAQNDGLPIGSKFIKRNTITTGNFVVGEEYKILNVGDTDFTLIGADSNTVGEWFVATGVGGGTTGTAVTESIEIV